MSADSNSPAAAKSPVAIVGASAAAVVVVIFAAATAWFVMRKKPRAEKEGAKDDDIVESKAMTSAEADAGSTAVSVDDRGHSRETAAVDITLMLDTPPKATPQTGYAFYDMFCGSEV